MLGTWSSVPQCPDGNQREGFCQIRRAPFSVHNEHDSIEKCSSSDSELDAVLPRNTVIISPNRTLLSNVLFLIGCIFYLAVDSLDFKEERFVDDDDDDDDDAYIELFTINHDFPVTKFMILYFAAATCFLLNGIVDFVHWKYEQRNYRKKRLSLKGDTRVLSSPGALESERWKESSAIACELESNSAENVEKLLKDKSHLPAPFLSKRNVIYSHCDVSLEAYVAVLLGMGGAMDLIAALLVEEYEEASDFFNAVACHLYFLEAVVAIYGRKVLTRDGNKQGSWSHWGDLLFLVGSFIDVMCGYCYLVPSISDSLWLAGFAVFSSVLWLVDALLYMVSMVLET